MRNLESTGGRGLSNPREGGATEVSVASSTGAHRGGMRFHPGGIGVALRVWSGHGSMVGLLSGVGVPE